MFFDKTADFLLAKDEAGKGLACHYDGRQSLDSGLAGSGKVGGDLDSFDFKVGIEGGDFFQGAARHKAARTKGGAVDLDFHGLSLSFDEIFQVGLFSLRRDEYLQVLIPAAYKMLAEQGAHGAFQLRQGVVLMDKIFAIVVLCNHG